MTRLYSQDSILAPDTRIRIDSILISGNKTTKEFIILRELTFSVGDTMLAGNFSEERIQSQKNLLNTSLFNFVTITFTSFYTQYDGTELLKVHINVRERWYTWPAPIFDVLEPNLNTWWRNGHNFDRASYGAMLTRYNFRGRRETVAAIARFGYSQQFGAQYSIPFLNKKQTMGITLTGLYTRNHEVFYATQDHLLVYYKDEDYRIRKEISASAKLSYRKGIYQRNTLEVRYTDLSVFDTVVDLRPDYFTEGSDRMRYFTLSYQYVRDYRDAKAYPLHGHLCDFEITRHGLGIFPDEKLNITFFAASVRKWFQLGKTRFFGGGMVRGRILPGPVPPYYHQRALGFSTYIRGFEYYVIDGQNYVIGKSVFRYQLLKPRIFEFKWFPLEKFNKLHLAVYTGVFCDAGYVEDKSSTVNDNNNLGNKWLTGYGAGIDLVTYYDMTFRVEYAFNNLAEGGLYLHFGAPF